jgi:hypothetical protein
MYKNASSFLLVSSVLCLLQGCSSIPKMCPNESKACESGIINTFFTQSNATVFSKEKAYMGNQRPELGIAISGGGTRVASFSMGV